jgi:hypothetical protein
MPVLPLGLSPSQGALSLSEQRYRIVRFCFLLKGPESASSLRLWNTDLPKALAFDRNLTQTRKSFSRHVEHDISIVLLIMYFV